ncbi:MAG TPA: SDR family oxidoreductase [Noviherbaspirillum sp.]|jgi:3-oxoacyl-[acyl-carrier protein] reductase|uniref:SDR family NAD(P)-dependent oxidoreductase n=1 Tax=Noviherbaspirillum sp. TaxID=1926288 RepID=UPI002DDDA5FF|nr:SDR family oxidoreductase [Noviherbaspirillum sp.]HEV2609870.1 SDR family oxidoreductase [Noviherbaspirillum sp.]
MQNMKDKVVIVTGASSGIGAACATTLAANGARVVVNFSRSENEALAVAEQCKQLGGDTMPLQADVSKDADCRRLAQQVLDRWGRIDGLINNAGTTKFVDFADLDGLSAEDFQDIYAVNTVGPFQMARACAPALRAGGKGAIVNISSIAGVRGAGSSIAYAASKGALNTLTIALAKTLGPQIRVNAICPGFIEGKWLRAGLGDERYEARRTIYMDRAPLHDVVEPADVAETALWLLSGAAKTTGELIMVDSGFNLA